MAYTEHVVRTLDVAISKLESGWTRGSNAVDADGAVTDATSKSACKWCAVGALSAAASEVAADDTQDHRIYCNSMAVLMLFFPYGNIVAYNDAKGRRAASVIKRFKKARDSLKSKK